LSSQAASRASLDGQTALVTGASSGIGRSISLALSSRGAEVWIVGRRSGALADTAAAGQGSRLRPLVADLVDDAQIAGLRDAVAASDRGLDVLVHCAGMITLADTESARVSDFDAQFRANLRAPFMLTQALLPMLKASRGDIVFVNSTSALGLRPGLGQYAATKAGLRALTDSLRGEVNGDGVRVLSIFPGRTATPTQEQIHAMEGKEYVPERLMQPDDVASMVVAALALPRTAEVTEIVLRPLVKPPA
jgi:NAD(P)-dependent dehydrogenase (short-subunit alcohol dehydrogenase family)